jgi:hypothetical protein
MLEGSNALRVEEVVLGGRDWKWPEIANLSQKVRV